MFGLWSSKKKSVQPEGETTMSGLIPELSHRHHVENRILLGQDDKGHFVYSGDVSGSSHCVMVDVTPDFFEHVCDDVLQDTSVLHCVSAPVGDESALVKEYHHPVTAVKSLADRARFYAGSRHRIQHRQYVVIDDVGAVLDRAESEGVLDECVRDLKVIIREGRYGSLFVLCRYTSAWADSVTDEGVRSMLALLGRSADVFVVNHGREYSVRAQKGSGDSVSFVFPVEEV